MRLIITGHDRDGQLPSDIDWHLRATLVGGGWR